MSLLRTIRTVRHLRPVQIAGQVRNRLRPLWERPARFAARPVPAYPGCAWQPGRRFPAPGAQENSASGIGRGRFRFLNREEDLGWPVDDWAAPGLPKLWQYNLHYFEWLWALEYPESREAVEDWIDRYGLDAGRVGWEPYPITLRLMNWCAVYFGKFRAEVEQDPTFRDLLWGSIYVQAEWLYRHRETHLQGNHLLENGAALAFAGSCFSGRVARAWREKGLKTLRDEIPTQFLPDGMHYERSPMYHVRLVYVLTLLAATGNDALVSLVVPVLGKTANALASLCHPDGQIALLNDSAFNIYNDPADFLPPGTRSAAGHWSLPDAGYYGYRSESGTYIICDAGPVGPDHIPGHAHGDIFSFELSLAGQRAIVDSGVFDYVPGEMRAYCRSTAAHNTVEIDGFDQCEFWGAFRVARRGYPRNVQWEPLPDGFRLRGAHNGYRRLPGRPVHTRCFSWSDGSGLQIEDEVTAPVAQLVRSHIHLHPSCEVRESTDRRALIQFSGGCFQVEVSGGSRLRQSESWYCPEFGRRVKNICLTLEAFGKDVSLGYRVSIAPDAE